MRWRKASSSARGANSPVLSHEFFVATIRTMPPAVISRFTLNPKAESLTMTHAGASRSLG